MQPTNNQLEDLLNQLIEFVPEQNLQSLGLQFHKLKLEFSKQKDAFKKIEVENKELQKRFKEKDQECRKLKKQEKKLKKELQISEENISRLTISKRTKSFSETTTKVTVGPIKKNKIQKVYSEEQQEEKLIVQHNIKEEIIKKIRSENVELIKKLENLENHNKDLFAQNTALKLVLQKMEEKILEIQKLGVDSDSAMSENDSEQDSIDINDDIQSYVSEQTQNINNLQTKKSALAKLQDIEQQDEDNEVMIQKKIINKQIVTKETNKPELTNDSNATQASFIKKFSTKLKQWWHLCDK